MKAKLVKEDLNFERDQDPKKAMDLGIKGYEDYLNKKLRGRGENPSEFWESFYNTYQDRGSDILEEMMEILKNTPIDFQVMWAEEKLSDWDEFNK